jgi:hypothetical protein
MSKIIEDSKCLASLAVFRELYNSEKDIYGIIGEFLKEIISSRAKHQFTLTEITQLLNDTFDFKIPEAVVSTALSRFKGSLEKAQGLYTIKNLATFSISGKLTEKHSLIQNNNNIIIENLLKFIEAEKKAYIDEEEKEKIVTSFCSFLIDESTAQEYSDYVSAFIINNKKDSSFTNQLNTIKEGVVLYTGLKYNPNLNDLGSWKTELTIFIDTEILFHFAGFNGQLFQILFNDFFSLVKEINAKNQSKKGKKLIHLRYFSEVKGEIENFFKKAEYIVSGKDKANPSKTAMTSILDGCKSPAEVIEKKTKFYDLLKLNAILEDDFGDYYSEYYHKYNIEDQNIITQLIKNTGIEEVSSHLRYLNFINIHRRGINDRGFDNVGYFLLTGTIATIILAWDEALKPEGNVPLASNLSFITNKFWFKLNKGFGKGEYPKTFDIVTKAQIVLSTLLNNSVADKFDELQIKFRNGELTEQEAISSITELRRQAKRPEDINEYELDTVLRSIEEKSIEQYLQEQELFKNNAQKQEEENKKLKESLANAEREKRQKEQEFQEMLRQKEQENYFKEEELNNIRGLLKIKTAKKEKRIRLLKKIGLITGFLIIVAGGVLLYIYFNKALGIVTGTIAGLFTIATFFNINYNTIRNLFRNE